MFLFSLKTLKWNSWIFFSIWRLTHLWLLHHNVALNLSSDILLFRINPLQHTSYLISQALKKIVFGFFFLSMDVWRIWNWLFMLILVSICYFWLKIKFPFSEQWLHFNETQWNQSTKLNSPPPCPREYKSTFFTFSLSCTNKLLSGIRICKILSAWELNKFPKNHLTHYFCQTVQNASKHLD